MSDNLMTVLKFVAIAAAAVKAVIDAVVASRQLRQSEKRETTDA